MAKKQEAGTINALFGSKTRVKLLHLFLNNPDKSFYVREITRLIDEQINSVRRELSNMMDVGIITSETEDNKLYYKANKKYEFFGPFKDIFAPLKRVSSNVGPRQKTEADGGWQEDVRTLKGLRIAIAAGILVEGSASSVDLLLVGSPAPSKTKQVIERVESAEGREINYTVMTYDEFYYRLSVRDRFIMELFAGKHLTIVDTDNIVTE